MIIVKSWLINFRCVRVRAAALVLPPIRRRPRCLLPSVRLASIASRPSCRPSCLAALLPCPPSVRLCYIFALCNNGAYFPHFRRPPAAVNLPVVPLPTPINLPIFDFTIFTFEFIFVPRNEVSIFLIFKTYLIRN